MKKKNKDITKVNRIVFEDYDPKLTIKQRIINIMKRIWKVK